jgi:hypothetical protein
VSCDASGVAIDAVLSQDNKTISYFSEKLNDTKRKYSTYDKEIYVVIQALKKWTHYLIPKDFVLYSDNQALQLITRQEKLNQRHDKWVEFMQNFTFFINHSSGSANKVANSLSRGCLIMKEFQVETFYIEHKLVDRVSNSRCIIVQRKQTLYSKILNERQLFERKAQWKIGWTFRPWKDLCIAKFFIPLVKYKI